MIQSQKTLFQPSGKPVAPSDVLDLREMPVTITYGLLPSNENAIALVIHCPSEEACPAVNAALEQMRRQGFFRLRTRAGDGR